MIGWIKTHRSKLQWEWFTDYKTAHLFEYILLCASHNEYKWRGTKFVAGQLPFGLTKASSESGLSVQSIRTSLSKLEATGEIARESSNQGTVITVIKWKEYQIEDSTPTSKSTGKITSKQQASNKQSTTTKNVKNVKNDKNNISIENKQIKEIIDLTNNILCKKFKHTSKESRNVILARLKENYTIKDFEYVARVKKQDWDGDEKMRKFLQPSTLFGNKFDKYLNQELVKTREDIESELVSMFESCGITSVN
tara:strand:+ start:688 stop:1443 length:756 start_codon:yes stop_codon:yes gene_type:complete